ncbi:SLAM family member 5-like [Lepus europaeus]|uniref:SLAM family member 5-like n=1 Tax=Lepus europaeus TaxID=9983 RepID=UPI002B480100|nr:SLAM family member 5-like [Lepus europaeus]
MSLTIENVTSQDSGHYRAQVRFTGGFSSTQVFYLTVYEPVPAPQILAESPSITSGWCNITLQCRATGATEQLNVSWESTGPPSELKQGGAPGPANNSWTLAVSLPLSQPKASLTCVVSNQGDQKSTTLDLSDVCVQGAALQRDHRGDDGGMHYAQLMKEETQDGQEKAVGRQHLGEQESIMTIYSQIHSPGQGMKII